MEGTIFPNLAFHNIKHLGWAVRDIDKTIEVFEKMGIGPWRRYVLGEFDGLHDFAYRTYEGGMDNRCKVALAKFGPIVLELFDPTGGQFPIVEQFLEAHGEGIWHFGFSVTHEQLDRTVEEMKEKGINIIGQSEYKNGVRMVFLDPEQTGGIIFQLHDCLPEAEGFFDTMGIMV